MQKYFAEIERKVRVEYSIAEEARKKGFDPKSKIESPLATSLAQRAVELISSLYPQLNSTHLINRIKELEQEHGLLDHAVCLRIAEEIAKEKFCKFQSHLEAVDAGFRVGFAYITLGVVASPLEGYTHFKLQKTGNGEDYFAAYYSGPIRSAGTTAGAFSLLLLDYLRKMFGYAVYDATEKEAKRGITEIYDYHERVANLQYLASEEELEFLFKNIPLQVTGLPTEQREVSNYKDLERVDTNLIRGGFALTISECLAQKAAKLLKIKSKLVEKGFNLEDWNFLDEFVKLQRKLVEKKTEQATGTYLKDLVAGRPVFGHPSYSGAFRLRYGRTRCTGYSALAIHPATMAALDDFIAFGTQIRLEKPTKAAAVTCCDTIDGPVVKLHNGRVLKLQDKKEALKLFKEIKEILYLGDLLIPFGDFANRNHPLLPSGYVEEYWLAELKEKSRETAETVNERKVSMEKAEELSKEYGVSLHPSYIFYWRELNREKFIALLKLVEKARFVEGKLILPVEENGKRALELLAVPHFLSLENIIIEEPSAKALLVNLGLENSLDREKILKMLAETEKQDDGVLDIVNKFSSFEIRDKSGTFIGSRMGRPEKAKLRELTGSPHVLFPVGEAGGRFRSVQEACETDVKADFPLYHCDNCNIETVYFICEQCGNQTRKTYYCRGCDINLNIDYCPTHGTAVDFMTKRLDIKHYLDSAIKKLNMQKTEVPVLIKGVRGTSSESHIPEHLSKGVLRAMFGLNVNKDGTIRYDAVEVPITHFKPKEIHVEISKLREVGYTHDIHGQELENEEQILEIKPHDVILPCAPDSLDEQADEVFIRVCKFIDNLLVRLYGLRPFYNVNNRGDLIGKLTVGIAPHNCAGVVCRIIGFSNTQSFLASPYIHAAMRRDCDGDEASLSMLMDVLLNFSRGYLPAHRGGTQDAPLVLNARIRPGEVDDMIFDIDIAKELPIEFYRAAEKQVMPHTIKMPQVKDKVGSDEAFQNLHYTHETSDIASGTTCSSYKKIATMQEKVQRQMELVEKIRAVDTADVASLIIQRHLIRDIRGNLRKFSMQQFRCVKCNEKYRRPPLQENCIKCSGRIIFTISEGGVIKYLELALQLAKKYEVSDYIKQSLELTQRYIESVFGRENEKQEALQRWF
ncbi:DNA polymerase II large subunit [Candidatus Pacearchaeota archaeon]|nr:DNA polymerase II large subunit [Candidatus Pacearchaeota archaeon]